LGGIKKIDSQPALIRWRRLAFKSRPPIPPTVKLVEPTATSLPEMAEKLWPKPSALPPLKKKTPAPPPMQPRPRFPGKY
jgi:hypothetical protein